MGNYVATVARNVINVVKLVLSIISESWNCSEGGLCCQNRGVGLT